MLNHETFTQAEKAQLYRRLDWWDRQWVPILGKPFKDPPRSASPFFRPDPDRPGKYQVVPRRPVVFVTGVWDSVVRHVHLMSLVMVVLGELDHQSRVRTWTDMDLIDLRFSREAEQTFSQTVTEPGLVLVRLGVQSTRNGELPGIVLELAKLRDIARRPLVLVLDPSSPWKSHLAYSGELEHWLSERAFRTRVT